MICDSNIETNFPHKLLVADTQILRLCKASVNSSSAIIKLSKIQLSTLSHILFILFTENNENVQ